MLVVAVGCCRHLSMLLLWFLVVAMCNSGGDACCCLLLLLEITSCWYRSRCFMCVVLFVAVAVCAVVKFVGACCCWYPVAANAVWCDFVVCCCRCLLFAVLGVVAC